jgi:murein DD-endopeptidase MepM/ murein hydrolase activator NlpD
MAVNVCGRCRRFVRTGGNWRLGGPSRRFLWGVIVMAASGMDAGASWEAASRRERVQAPEAACMRSADAAVSYRARALEPGEVVLVSARLTPAPEEVRLEAFGQSVRMVSDSANPALRRGMVGLDLDIQPGPYQIAIAAAPAEGPLATIDGVAVAAKTFPTRSIRVPPRYATPPPQVLARIEREAEMLRALLAEASPEQLWRGGFRMPVPGPVISAFGKRSIVNGIPRSPHAGIDLRARKGTPLRAPNGGRVTLVDDLYYTGTTIVIDHGLGVHSVLCHLSSARVRVGDEVTRSQLIGATGATGRATGPHLHWSIRANGARVDPLSLMAVTSGKAPAVSLPACDPGDPSVSGSASGGQSLRSAEIGSNRAAFHAGSQQAAAATTDSARKAAAMTSGS